MEKKKMYEAKKKRNQNMKEKERDTKNLTILKKQSK